MISLIIPVLFVLLNLEEKRKKRGKEEKKIQKFEHLKNKNSFLDEIKNIFHSF